MQILFPMPGTESEASRWLVISNKATKIKYR